MTVSEAFGPNLRRERMRRGVTLDELSLRTKVSVELWEALERNDFSAWPRGIYARAYIREYASLVGLDPDTTVDDFCRSFPHGDRRVEPLLREHAEIVGHSLAAADHPLPPEAGGGDRRMASSSPFTRQVVRARSPRELRVIAAVVDGSMVLLLTGFAAIFVPQHFWLALALVALAYHGVSMAVAGCSPAVWAVLAYATARPRTRASDARLFPRFRRDEG